MDTINDVALLDGISRIEYTLASHLLVHRWLKGNVGSGAPENETEKRLILEASRSILPVDTSLDELDKDDRLNFCSELLIQKGVLNAVHIANSHRQWIRGTYFFLRECGITFSGDMEEQVMKHDLSKFSPEEVLGYGTMFKPGQLGFKTLQGDEKVEWESALEHHYRSNPHHPEYFYPKKTESGERVKDLIIHEIKQNGKLYMEESLVDMLASRGERSLCEDAEVDVEKWMDIQEMYFKRYSDGDREWVKNKLAAWKEEVLTTIKRQEDNAVFLKILGKQVVSSCQLDLTVSEYIDTDLHYHIKITMLTEPFSVPFSPAYPINLVKTEIRE
ncbi:hypothetical protein CHS0354_042706 [Potamilus streckersoni]|uniref:Uncharacterized protein n=1 Tax=Potamilus streckersoni TaxID=2493646 RepID=A0AAE0S9C9_9BIVA|nr:hypothetical protein CHS0354_042706 [Potamilus streckersoni]